MACNGSGSCDWSPCPHETDDDEREPTPEPCVQCGSFDMFLLGVLGRLVWFRCAACGWQQSEELREE